LADDWATEDDGGGGPSFGLHGPHHSVSYSPHQQDVGVREQTIQAIQFATFLKAEIVVQRTNERKCGYLIQPKVWFRKMTPVVSEMLEDLGLSSQKSYVKEEDIGVILNAVRGLEDFSATPEGIEMVRRFNGRLTQPTTYDEVVSVLSLLDEEARKMKSL